MKNDPSFDLTQLKKELERIKSSISRIEELVNDDSRSTNVWHRPPQQHRTDKNSYSAQPSNFSIVRDRYGSDINIGDRVEFLTKGKYVSKE